MRPLYDPRPVRPRLWLHRFCLWLLAATLLVALGYGCWPH